MENLGLFKGLPAPMLTKEQAAALFRANQQNRKLNRVPGAQFDPMPGKQVPAESPTKKQE